MAVTDVRTEYKSNLKYSYMVLLSETAGEPKDRLVAEQMCEGRHISGLLTVRQMPMDSRMTYWYNITGLISLSSYVGRNRLDGTFVAALLSALKSLHDTLLRFYLDERHVVADCTHIYLNETGREFFFCYEPDHVGNLQEELCETAESLLDAIDHQDEAAVAYGYAFYQQMASASPDLWRQIGEVLRSTPTRDEALLARHRRSEEEDRIEEERFSVYESSATAPALDARPDISSKRSHLKLPSICDNLLSRINKLYEGGEDNGQSIIRLWKDRRLHLGG